MNWFIIYYSPFDCVEFLSETTSLTVRRQSKEKRKMHLSFWSNGMFFVFLNSQIQLKVRQINSHRINRIQSWNKHKLHLTMASNMLTLQLVSCACKWTIYHLKFKFVIVKTSDPTVGFQPKTKKQSTISNWYAILLCETIAKFEIIFVHCSIPNTIYMHHKKVDEPDLQKYTTR